jgi:hypothetical protein
MWVHMLLSAHTSGVAKREGVEDSSFYLSARKAVCGSILWFNETILLGYPGNQNTARMFLFEIRKLSAK